MKSILERALVHLLNEENEKAEELLHQFVIETAKGIHETLREGDEECLEDENLEEAAFGEADLEDDAAAELGADLGEEMPEVADAGDVADDTLDGEAAVDGEVAADVDADLGAEAAPAEGDIEAEIENFEQELADLQSKFDAWMSEIEGGEEVEGEVEGEGEAALAADADADAVEGEVEAGAEGDFGGEVASAEGDELAGEDDFDDITESVVSELQKVAAETAEGKGATGQDLLGNKTSPKSARNATAKPINIKSDTHKGFARETAPSVAPIKGGSTTTSGAKNTRPNGDPKTPDTGKGADIRKTAPDAANAKSPLTTKPKK